MGAELLVGQVTKQTPVSMLYVPYTAVHVACDLTTDAHPLLFGLSALQVMVCGSGFAHCLLRLLVTASWMCARVWSTAVVLLYLCILGLEGFVTVPSSW